MDNECYVTGLKACAKCGQPKPIGDFGISRSRPDGRNPMCRSCRSDYNRAAYKADPTPQKQRVTKWRERHPDYAEQYREQNLEAIRERAKVAYTRAMTEGDNRDAYNEYHRAYRAANRDRVREISRRNYKKTKVENPDQLNDKRQKRRQRERQAGWVTRQVKVAVFAHYGPACYLCNRDATEVDHYQPLAAGGRTELVNLRPVCASCNARKGMVWPFDEAELRARILAEYAADRPSEVA